MIHCWSLSLGTFLAVSRSRLQMVEATTEREEARLSVSRSLCPEAGLGCRDCCMAGPRLGVSTRDTSGIYRQTAGRLEVSRGAGTTGRYTHYSHRGGVRCRVAW